MPVGHRGQGRGGGDQAADVERPALGVGHVLRVGVHRAQPGEERDEHRHRVAVPGEAVEEAGERIGDALERPDLGPPARALRGSRQFAVQDQPGDVEVGRASGELVDGVAAVAEDALVAVDVGDPADAGGGVLERRVVGGESRFFGVGAHLAEPGGPDRSVLDVEAIVCPGAAVGEGQSPLIEGAVSVCSVVLDQGRAILSGTSRETDDGFDDASRNPGGRCVMGRERFAEVAIVGGGVMGASIAAHLAERKVGRVVVFEREDALGTGSTAKAAGGVRLQFTTAANVALSRYSMEEIRNFRERTGVDADFAQDGYLFLLNSEEDLRRFSETAVVQRALGAPVEVITPEEAARILPGIVTDDLVGATFCGEDGVATPAALVAGYGSLARRSGAELRRGCEVTSVSVVAGGGFAFVAGGERWECDWLVNAAGPWAGQVGALLGVEVPVSPMRRQFFTTEPLSWVPKKMPLTIDWGTGVYMHVHSGGMLIGNSDPDESPGFSQTPDLDYLAGVWEDAARRMPRVEEASMKTLNAGLYEVSPDHNAILGPVPEIPRFVLANGFSGHGMQHSPAVGKAISEVIADGESRTLDISAFSVARFAVGTAVPEGNVI